MSSRNLTHQAPLEDDSLSSSSGSTLNPFGNQNQYVDEQDSSALYQLDDLEYSTDSSSPNNTTSGKENNRGSTFGNSLTDFTPPEFDRYPRSASNSRVVSLTSSTLGSRASLLHRDESDTSSNLSNMAAGSNPFITDSDFSPFGGYPLSSFPLHIEDEEPDDYLHNPDPILDLKYEKNRLLHDLQNMDKRSATGLIGFFLLTSGAIFVFVILPVITYTGVVDRPQRSSPSSHRFGNHFGNGTNGSTVTLLSNYVYPQLSAIRTSLVDPDTPRDALTRTLRDGSDWQLVFSDEFNAEGRTFYEGDEQFWYAPDFNYASTQDLGWYDPDAVSTLNGTLQLRMDAIKQHNLFYRSGMVHSWNRMCFTQGIMEVSVKLPHRGNVSGLWPGMWSMGNLGRPGYMATTEGVWPYSYEACDAGITANQSSPDGISFLPGQKLSSCTCPGEDHPNPGTGRGAPEIDIFEGAMDTNIGVGVASQSLQVAPYDIWYYPDYRFVEIYNKSVSAMNTYTGGPFQQAISATTTLNTRWYQRGAFEEGEFQKYSFEYLNDNDDGYIRWFVGDDPTMTLHLYLLLPNGNIDWRRISKEPMSMILNLGVSNSWAYVDWNSIELPLTMEIDHVRVYQPSDAISVTCDPEDHPTADYIELHPRAYQNYNFTSWTRAGYGFPENRLTGSCA